MSWTLPSRLACTTSGLLYFGTLACAENDQAIQPPCCFLELERAWNEDDWAAQGLGVAWIGGLGGKGEWGPQESLKKRP